MYIVLVVANTQILEPSLKMKVDFLMMPGMRLFNSAMLMRISPL